jgi:hypothetical protein
MGERKDDSLAPGTHGERAGVRGQPRDETRLSAKSPASETPIRARHLRAPQGDGEVLIEPASSQTEQLICQNQARLANSQFTNCGSLFDLAQTARQDLVDLAGEYSQRRHGRLTGQNIRVILAGHQPELFHPGVWLKNFVLSNALYDATWISGFLNEPPVNVAINLVIDNDTAGATSIRVPSGTLSQPRIADFALDDPYENVPFEERPVVSTAMVRDFASRLRSQFDASNWLSPGHPTELLADRINRSLEIPTAGKVQQPLGELLAHARYRVEQELDLYTLELPLSRVAGTLMFQWFAGLICLELSRFQEVYNRSLAEYRTINHIRSNKHPVPALVVDGDWLEAPFWIWTTSNPRRRRLFVRRLAAADGRVTLEYSDRDQVTYQIVGSERDFFDGMLKQIQPERRGIKIRPRALITTMYARLFLSDLFIHGIGGAKYDELTDAIIRRFFGIEPPAYMTVTGTVRLPIPRPATTEADVRNAKQLIREIRFHPERFINDASPAIRESAAQFAAQKQELLRQHQFHFRQASREEFRALDDLNRKLSTLLTDVEIRLRDELHDREREVHAAKILGSREFSFVLHPADELPEQLKKMASSS